MIAATRGGVRGGPLGLANERLTLVEIFGRESNAVYDIHQVMNNLIIQARTEYTKYNTDDHAPLTESLVSINGNVMASFPEDLKKLVLSTINVNTMKGRANGPARGLGMYLDEWIGESVFEESTLLSSFAISYGSTTNMEEACSLLRACKFPKVAKTHLGVNSFIAKAVNAEV